MNKWKYSPPFFMKYLFPEFKWSTSNSKILITFDDGPLPGNSEKILKYLSENKIKSIFFCVGNNLEENISLAKEILSEGHLIGNHMPLHQIITGMKTSEIIKNIKEVNETAREKLNYEIKYFRPPHGKFDLRTSKILKEFGMTNVMWSLITWDFRNDIKLVKNASGRFLKQDSIVVFHDSIKSSEIIIESLEFLLETAEKRNYGIGVPEECLK
ncbi:MAG: polysaccharide deacetylase family protein [Ignavibacteria bacterium]|nr:polysaccharide deacetylase family protein [Ignavibacteria bacterium]